MQIERMRTRSWLLAAVLAAWTASARAEQITWDGGCGTKSWIDECIDPVTSRLKTNWHNDKLPTLTSDVVIPAGAGEVQVDGFRRINTIDVASKLSVTGNLQIFSTQQASKIKDLTVDGEAEILIKKELTLSGNSSVIYLMGASLLPR